MKGEGDIKNPNKEGNNGDGTNVGKSTNRRAPVGLPPNVMMRPRGGNQSLRQGSLRSSSSSVVGRTLSTEYSTSGSASGAEEESSSNDSIQTSQSDYDFNSEEKTNDKSSKEKNRGLFSFNGKKSSKKKWIFIEIVAAIIIFCILFLIVFIVPLINLGIIDIEGISGSGVGGFLSYNEVDKLYWWPVATITDGLTIDKGDPVSVNITSDFGVRKDPYSGKESGHGGIDIGNAGYSWDVINIIASRSGTVIYPTSGSPTYCPSNKEEDGCGGGYGNYVMIQHDDGIVTLYGHLSQDSITVKAGDTVKQGQVIGKMGSSGRSTGAHLHFEVRVDGSRVNPLNYVSADNPRQVSRGNSYVEGDSVKQSTCLSLYANNFSTNGVIALMTNINSESSFVISTLGDGGTSYGLCQWHNERFENLKSTFPNNYQTVEGQVGFLIYELQNNYSGLYQDLITGKDSAYDLAYRFCLKFERPAGGENSCRKRGDNAKNFTSYVKNKCN